MTAIRAEMPCIAIAFTSIGFVHGVRMLFLEGSELTQEPWLKTQWGEREQNRKAISGNCLFVER
jgi:hypothetical protein